MSVARRKLTTKSTSQDRYHGMFDNLREDWATCEQDIWRIGPNAVVLQDVPVDFIVIGIPARTIPRPSDDGVRRAENIQRLSQS